MRSKRNKEKQKQGTRGGVGVGGRGGRDSVGMELTFIATPNLIAMRKIRTRGTRSVHGIRRRIFESVSFQSSL
jgi:hypothetical protein